MVIWGWMMRVRLDVGVPALLCGYALVWAYPLHTEVLTGRVRLGVGLPAPLCGYALVWAYPLYCAGTPWCGRTRSTVRVRAGVVVSAPLRGCGLTCSTVRVSLGVGVPALLCGYACLVEYPPLIAVFTLRVRHGEGLPAVY